MLQIRLKALVQLALVSSLTFSLPAQGPSASKQTLKTIEIQSTPEYWIKGYSSWVSHDQRAAEELFHTKSQPAPDDPNVKRSNSNPLYQGQLVLRTPYVMYFGADGNPLFTGMDVNENVAFIDKWPDSVPAKLSAEAGPQPALADYLQFFPQMDAYKAPILAEKRPVLLSVCAETKATCKQQIASIDSFRERVGAKVQIIEVTLIKPAA